MGEQAAFSESDLDALSTLVGTVENGAIDFETAVRMTRAVGQTMARLADWQVATLTHRVEQLESGEEATGSRIGSAMRIAEQVGEPFEKMLIYSWRRHLAAAVSRVEALGANDEDLHTTQVTVGFADLVSFTALSNEMDEDRLGGHGGDLRVPLRRRGRGQARPGDQDPRRLGAVRLRGPGPRRWTSRTTSSR